MKYLLLIAAAILAIMALLGPAENDALSAHGEWYGRVQEQGAVVM